MTYNCQVTPDVKGSPSPDVRRVNSPVINTGATTKKQTAAAAAAAGSTAKGTALSVRTRDSAHKASIPKEELKVLVDANEEGRSSSHSSMEEVSQTPPPKEDEFEKFKKGRGQKIHEAFLSNKGIVHRCVIGAMDRNLCPSYTTILCIIV